MASLFYTAPTVTSESFDVKIGQQLDEVEISSGAEGSSINRLWGRHRMAGKLIWATNFKEVATEVVVGSQTTSGGKGGGGSSSTTYQTQTSYSYFCSFAFGLCEGGEGVQMGRIWIDGKLIEQGQYSIRFYPGTEDQQPDDWIETVEGVGNVPAFRGTAYVVFQEFPLAEFGNRIPAVTVEVIKPLENLTEDDLEKALQGVCMIPASGEMSYATSVHFQDDGYGTAATVNMHNGTGEPDAVVSLDQLESQSENVDIRFFWLSRGSEMISGLANARSSRRSSSSLSMTTPRRRRGRTIWSSATGRRSASRTMSPARTTCRFSRSSRMAIRSSRP